MALARLPFALALAALAWAATALAVQPDEMLADPALEARARNLSRELRCMVCQNQSIDDSDAPLARDIRLLIRERIGQGEGNDAVRAYLVSRYGQFVLLTPKASLGNAILWAAPIVIVLGGAAALIAHRRPAPEPEPLTAQEEAELSARCEADEA